MGHLGCGGRTSTQAVSRSVITSTIPVSIRFLTHLAIALALAVASAPKARAAPAPAAAKSAGYEFDDSHFHLTNYIQEGITPQQFLKIMGTRVGRSTLFGIPLQQEWSFRNSGDDAPTYYLDSDSPLYYY